MCLGRQSQEDWLPASARHPASKNYSRKGEREIPGEVERERREMRVKKSESGLEGEPRKNK